MQAIVVGFADDIGVVITSNQPDEVQIYANETIRTTKSWLKDHGLELAKHETDLVLFTKRAEIENCLNVFGPQPTLKYLGVTFDSKLSFKPYLKLTGQKAATIT